MTLIRKLIALGALKNKIVDENSQDRGGVGSLRRGWFSRAWVDVRMVVTPMTLEICKEFRA